MAREAAAAFYARLRELASQQKSITTFGPYSPGQAVTIKRMGIEGIYLGGWATSAKGSISEDPGPDLASYPLSQVPDEAAGLVRALLTADRNQQYLRLKMTPEQRAAAPEYDYRPFIIADADTGHGGDPHVRNLIRRFVEAGVPGYHIEDQRPGTKKCGHQGGKVLVPSDEQIKRLNTARFQLDIMRVPGIIVARTDAEAANLIDSRADERDQPFLLGATNLKVPPYKACFLALMRSFHAQGVTELRGHLLYALPDGEYDAADAWLERHGIADSGHRGGGVVEEGRAGGPANSVDDLFDAVESQLRRRLAGRRRTGDLRRGGGRAGGVPRARGRAAGNDPCGVAGIRRRPPRCTPPARRPGSWAPTFRGTANGRRPRRATTRSAAASRTRSRSRWRLRRSPTSSGWRPRPPTWPTPGSSPRPSAPSTRTR